MPRAPVPPAVDAFLRRPNLAVLAYLRPRGAPDSLATWYDWEDGRVLLNLDPVRSPARLRWLRRDGRISLTAIDPETFYRHVTVRAEVERIEDDAGLADIDRLSLRYTGAPYTRRENPRVSVWARAIAWHAWDRDPREAARPDGERLPRR